jgi:hypothetical protein
VEVVRFTQARRGAALAGLTRRGTMASRSSYATSRTPPVRGEFVVLVRQLPGLAAWARGVAALPDAHGDAGAQRSRSNVAFAEERALVGDGVIVERPLGLEFGWSGNAFLQTNSAQAERPTGALAAARSPG